MAKYTHSLKQLFSASLFKNALFLIVGGSATSIMGFIFVIIATNLFQPEDVGLSSAAIAAVALISTISELGLGITLIRFLPESGKNEKALLNFFLTINITASIIVTAVFLFGLDIWSQSLLPLRQHTGVLLVFVFFAVTSSAQVLLFNVFLAKRQNKYLPLINGLTGLMKLIFLVLISLIFNNAFGILMAAGIATIIGSLLLIFYFIPKILPHYSFRPATRYYNYAELLRYAGGNYIGRLLLQITPLMMPLLVINTLGAESNAVFYVAWSVTAILQMISSAIFNSLFAEASNKAGSLKELTINSLKFMLFLVIPAIIIIILIADQLLLVFGRSYSEEGRLLLQIMACSAVPWGINYLYVSIARFEKHVGRLNIIAALSLVLCLCLSYILMLNMGVTGAGLGYLTGQSITAFIVVILMTRLFIRKRLHFQV